MADRPRSYELEPIARFSETIHQGLVLKPTNPVARAIRSLALRLMRPFIAYQESVNLSALASVEALQDRMTAYQVDLATALADARRAERKAHPTSLGDGSTIDE